MTNAKDLGDHMYDIRESKICINYQSSSKHKIRNYPLEI